MKTVPKSQTIAVGPFVRTGGMAGQPATWRPAGNDHRRCGDHRDEIWSTADVSSAAGITGDLIT